MTLTSKLITSMYASGKLTASQVMVAMAGKYITRDQAQAVLGDAFVDPDAAPPFVISDDILKILSALIKEATYSRADIDRLFANLGLDKIYSRDDIDKMIASVSNANGYTKDQIDDMFEKVELSSFPDIIDGGIADEAPDQQ